MKFNHLNVPTHWQNYWTRYPEGHTILEALISWVSQVDSMVDNQNKLNDNVEQFRNEIDDFVGRFDDRLKDEVVDTLEDWQNSGFLNVVIAEGLQWQLDDYIATNEQDKLSITTQLEDIAINITQYPRLTDEADDTGRFNRAIAYLTSKGGGTLQLKGEVYQLKTFTIPDNVKIKGIGHNGVWNFQKGSILNFIGSGVFININSYYQSSGSIEDVLIKSQSGSRNENTTAIQIKRDTNDWGPAALVKRLAINGFGVGIQHFVAHKSVVQDCIITECRIGISFKSEVQGSSQNPPSSFGNGNLIDKTTVFVCDIGIEIQSDTLSEYRDGVIEQCKIAIQYYKSGTPGFLLPQQWVFDKVWFEANTKYIICNSAIDSMYEATGQQVVNGFPQFIGCRNEFPPSPQIPTFNTNYETYSINNESGHRMFESDDKIQDFYKKPISYMDRLLLGNNGYHRELYSLSNKGMVVKVAFNTHEVEQEVTTTGTTTQSISINYSDIINVEADGLANYLSSMALMTVTTIHNDGSSCNATFIINDFAEYSILVSTQLGTTYQTYDGLLSGDQIAIKNITGVFPTDKTFDVQVTGNIIKKINVKINYFPNGLLVTL